MAPRFLAGPAGLRTAVLRPLHDASWSSVPYPASSGLCLRAPDSRVFLLYEPDTWSSPLWTFTAYARANDEVPRWSMTFTGQTPPEIVADVAEATARLHRQDSDSVVFGSSSSGPDPMRLFARLNWRPGSSPGGDHLTEPNALADFHHRTGVDPHREPEGLTERWLATGDCGAEETWFASASTATPLVLVHALARAITDPTPVSRDHLDHVHPNATIRPNQLLATAPRPTTAPAQQRADARQQAIGQPTAPAPQADHANGRTGAHPDHNRAASRTPPPGTRRRR